MKLLSLGNLCYIQYISASHQGIPEKQMTLSEYEEIGADICKIALTYLPHKIYKEKLKQVLDNISSFLDEHYLGLQQQKSPIMPCPTDEKTTKIEETKIHSEANSDGISSFKPDLDKISLELQNEKNKEPDKEDSDNDISSSDSEESLQKIILNEQYQNSSPTKKKED